MSGSVLKPVLAAGLVAVGVGGTWGLSAGDGPKPVADAQAAVKPKAETPAEQWKKLKAEYDAEIKANTTTNTDPKTGRPIPNSSSVRQPPAAKYADRLAALGRSDDPEVALAALTLSVCGWHQLPAAELALDLLLERFGTSPRLAGFDAEHRRIGYDGKVRRVQRVLGVATDPTARAYATMDLAHQLEGDRPGESPARAAERKAVVAVLYRTVVDEYAAVEGGRLSRWAASTLRNQETLRAGRPTPPLAGVAVDGRPMDLADFKGRVVVLAVGSSENTAWEYNAAWLKEVAAKYAGREVAVLGLLSQRRAEDAATAMTAIGSPWRAWADVRDPKTNEGPVHTAWGILTSPSVIVLDRAGVIRHPDLRTRDQVEAAVDALLAGK